jgi:uncharacterized OsmC-like protein
VDASGGKLDAEVRGEIEDDDGVLIIKRIHVTYHLRALEEQREVVARVHGFHRRFCPVYRSLEAAIDITTDLELDVEKESAA